jgi:hypothetical protein
LANISAAAVDEGKEEPLVNRQGEQEALEVEIHCRGTPDPSQTTRNVDWLNSHICMTT